MVPSTTVSDVQEPQALFTSYAVHSISEVCGLEVVDGGSSKRDGCIWRMEMINIFLRVSECQL